MYFTCNFSQQYIAAQKITTHLQRSLARHLGSCSYVKRLLQYNQSKNKNNHALFRSLTSHPLFSTHLLPHLLLLSTYFLRASCRVCSLLVSASRHERFSHAYASLACMYTLHACSASRFYYVHASLLYLYTSHLVLRVTMHTLHDTCYSVLCTCTAYF